MFKNIKYFPIFLYCLLFIAFMFGIDPNSGAKSDYINHINLFKDFQKNIFETLLNYEAYATRHSPVAYLIYSQFYKFISIDILVRFIFFNFAFALPYIFYKCLNYKYPLINKNYLILISSLICISPSFISLSIWFDSRIYGTIFFCLSIYYFLKFEKKENFFDVLKCVFSYTIASYISPNFAVFSIFYFYFFYLKYKFNQKLLIIIILNIILSSPAVIYIFFMDNNFLLNTAFVVSEFEKPNTYNYFNKILIISSLTLFYYIPFLYSEPNLKKYFSLSNLLISLLILIVLIFNFDYNTIFTGGGIILKLSNLIFDSSILLYCFGFFSILFIIQIAKFNSRNFFLIFLLILSNPQYTIYHKYYDPLLLILFLLLFDLEINKHKFFKLKNILIFYSYFLLFLIANVLR